MNVDDPAQHHVIALADDHPIVRAALKTALAGLGPRTRCVEAHDAASTLSLAAAHPDLDLMLLDLRMPGAEGTTNVRAVRTAAPALPIAVISADEDAAVVAELLRIGVCGFIPKSDSADVILGAVRLMLAGGVYVPPRLVAVRAPAAIAVAQDVAMDGDHGLGLTGRQLDVLRLLGRGLPNKLIARELGITEGTVKVHLLAVFRALNVRNRTAAVLSAQRYRA